MTKIELNNIVKHLPNSPGVYQFLNSDEVIIYVGKAKSLIKRVRSYFKQIHKDGKTNSLVKNIHNIRHIVVKTESDALLLENSLIKKFKPKYNILLKDDKTYPWICIKNERFPRVFYTRKMIKDGSDYYGPYTSLRVVKTILNIISSLYKLRTCSYDLNDQKVQNNKYKVCLEFHLGNCLGPCEDLQEEENYNQNIIEIKDILRGNFKNSLHSFRREMKVMADDLKFEQANLIKSKINALENYQYKSTVVNPKISNVDVFSYSEDENFVYVNFLQISFGSIVRSFNLEIKSKIDEGIKKILELAAIEIRLKFASNSPIIYCSIPIDLGENVSIEVPKIGDKKKIIDLSHKNAIQFKFDRLKQIKIVDPERHQNRILGRLKEDLNLDKIPVHIECFDNSNTQGTNPASACVVFRDGKPSKKDYRHFNIKTVTGPDDYASMEEVVFRRYSRLLSEGSDLPELIIIDGGKGQLSASLKSLIKLGLESKISIIGIAKRLEEIYFPNDSTPLFLDKKSESLILIQKLRNEAHRFSLKHHRNKRSENAFTNELNSIKGIGDTTMITLLKKFKSNDKISKLRFEDLQNSIGKSKAALVFNHYNAVKP
ncbi:MAG: excinuclease ABC subunit UvrC [Flavobacteriaceae bacterium]|nr:excinuclease ABC subunit UvrC [Flavobacteriaceae bacterium]CAI8273753.1 MAG: UvrABC system protein C [Flavobacteriaceae bacterium]|tara:strand:+ start:19 stop:1818 length:1800 start_codon:yes stop_codon:yes gene_type:complete